MPSGPSTHLGPVKAYMSAPVAGTSMGTFPTDWAPSTSVRTPRSRARAQISASGSTVPSVQSTWESAMRRVREVRTASIFSAVTGGETRSMSRPKRRAAGGGGRGRPGGRGEDGYYLPGRHRRRDEIEVEAEAAGRGVERHEAAGVFCCGRDHPVTRAPVDGDDAEVHAVGGVLGKGDVVGAGVYEAGGGLAGPGVGLGLVAEEAAALEAGRAGEVGGGRAHGLDGAA